MHNNDILSNPCFVDYMSFSLLLAISQQIYGVRTREGHEDNRKGQTNSLVYEPRIRQD